MQLCGWLVNVENPKLSGIQRLIKMALNCCREILGSASKTGRFRENLLEKGFI